MKVLVLPLYGVIADCLLIHSFIPSSCAECDNSLPFSGASSIPLCYVLFPSTLLHQLFFHSSLLCTFSCHPSPPTILPFLSVMYFFLPPFSTNYSSIPLCYVLFPATLLHQLFFHSSLLCTFSFHPSPPTILPFLSVT